MRRIIATLLIIGLVTTMAACGASDDKGATTGGNTAVLETDFGTVEIELFTDTAPIAAGNFKDKCDSGFYNGLTFHRIVNGFVIQGGDPLGTGTGGGDMDVDPFNSKDSNLRGTLAMASSTTGNREANQPMAYQSDAQFFINLSDRNTQLDNYGFIAFGKVIVGMDVVDAIANVKTTTGASGENSTPVEPVVINKAYTK